VTRAALAFAFLCAVFGTTFGAIAIGLRDGWPPLLSAGLRFTLAGVLVIGLAALRGELRRPSQRDLAGITLVGLSVTTATFAALYTAERVLPSSIAALLSASSPLFAFTLALWLGRRRLDVTAIAGLVLGTAGVALVVGFGRAHGGSGALLAALAIVASEIAYAGGLTATRGLLQRLPMLEVAGGQQLIGGFVLLVLSAAFEHRAPARLDPTGLAALLYLAVVASAGAHTIAIWLAGATSATFAASWTYVSPFIALLAGALWLHEPVGPSAWIGGALVVCGCVALNADLLRTPREREAAPV
jgi:drug/metabolite transporter (DMT)-like permease